MKRVVRLLAVIAAATSALGGTAVAQEQPDLAQGSVAPAAQTPNVVGAPRLSSSQPNAIRGQGLEANRVWVMGEVCNDGSSPAYNLTVTARLLTDSGTVAGTANQAFAFLGPGDSVGYRVEVRNAAAYERADLSIDASSSGFASFAVLPIDWVKNEQVKDSRSHLRYEFSGTLGNSDGRPVSLNAVYVWFLDDQDRVVWMDRTYISNSVAPGDSYIFNVRTVSDAENPQVSGISQVRYYAAGQLP